MPKISAAYFHISSLKNANTSNDTAASKQPNSFWFWEKYHCFFHVFLVNLCTTYEEKYDLKQAQDEIYAKNWFSSEPYCISAQDGPRK